MFEIGLKCRFIHAKSNLDSSTLVTLPSSTHNCIILPTNTKIRIYYIDNLVQLQAITTCFINRWFYNYDRKWYLTAWRHLQHSFEIKCKSFLLIKDRSHVSYFSWREEGSESLEFNNVSKAIPVIHYTLHRHTATTELSIQVYFKFVQLHVYNYMSFLGKFNLSKSLQ